MRMDDDNDNDKYKKFDDIWEIHRWRYELESCDKWV
jgi:hypothetical protein